MGWRVIEWRKGMDETGDEVCALCDWFSFDQITGELIPIKLTKHDCHGFHPCEF